MQLRVNKETLLHPLEVFQQGQFACIYCGGLMVIDDLPPLQAVICAYCGKELHVPQRIAGFWLFQYLGGGGMGIVFKACHEAYPDRFFAVKILPRGPKRDNPRLARNLENEASIAATLGEHPCLVRVLAAGQADGEHYMAMDYIAGDRLDKRIKNAGKMPENEVLLMALRVLAGLTHIYNRGFLYRDLKPGNIMISDTEGAYLYDFGICMSVEEALEEPAEDIVAGTPLYFPPERITGDGETAASEIYSLGMVMYHAMTGRSYFSARELDSLSRNDVRPMLLTARNKMDGISPYVAAVIEKMIQRDIAKRFQTFQDVERDIVRLLWLRLRRGSGKLLQGAEEQWQ